MCRIAAGWLATVASGCDTDSVVMVEPVAVVTAASGSRPPTAPQTTATVRPQAQEHAPAQAQTQPQATATPAPAEPTGLFGGTLVRTVSLRYAKADWLAQQQVLATKLGPPLDQELDPGNLPPLPQVPAWVPVEVSLGSQTWKWVGIRYKGNGSPIETYHLGMAKLPFRLDFDHFDLEHPETKGQLCNGLEKLTFANGWTDSTYLRDVLASEIMRERGVPAPRAAFYRVMVDHGDGPYYAGPHSAIEDPSDDLPTRELGAIGGNVYKAAGAGAGWQVFDTPSFSKQTNAKQQNWSDIEAAIAALHAPRADAAKWRTELQKRFAVAGFLRWLAVNTAIWNPDVYGLHAANYYLAGVPAQGGRLHWLPWDQNEAFRPPQAPYVQGQPSQTAYTKAVVHHTATTDQWPLIRYLLDDSVYAAQYDKELAKAVLGSYELQTFAARAKALHALIKPHVEGPQGEVWPHTVQFGAESGTYLQPPDDLIAHASAMHQLIQDALGAKF
ncbi:MAG: hypothetical protein EXR77_02640 [Myxococcales bacterium]|nr:hypothetical protein [Myxococcales bacterium]